MEHHSNIVPWQMVCKQTGAILKVAPIDSKGQLIMEDFSNMINTNTKLIAVSHVSNTLGTINPIEKIIDLGTSPNKGDGDPLRTAFTKINDNFTELYTGSPIVPQDLRGSVFGDDSTLLVDGVNNKVMLTTNR